MPISDVVTGIAKRYRILRLPLPSSLRSFLLSKYSKDLRNYSNPIKKTVLFYLSYLEEIEAQLTLPFIADTLLQSILETSYLEGDIIELGTYKGGSTTLIAHHLKTTRSKKHIYACDTFEGHPYDDITSACYCLKRGMGGDSSVNYVENKFRKFKVSDKIAIVKGKFEDTLLRQLGDRVFALAFLDCDLYQSGKFCYSFLYPRIVPGGCIVVHDYEEQQPDKPRSFGISLATDEFLKEKGLKIKRQGSSGYVIWFPNSEGDGKNCC